MMERLDAIAVLQGMHKKEFSLQTFAESNGNYTAEWYHSERAEALQVAIDVLETLERNKAKAGKVLTALRRCYDYPERCYGCPYHDDTNPACGRQMDDDIEELLAVAYEEWGENDEQS